MECNPAMDLDLDFLEKRGIGGEKKEESEEEGEKGEDEREETFHNSILSPEEYSPQDSSDLVKIILLGAPAVGKTSIVQQFVWNDFCETYYPTDRRHNYYPSVVNNGRLYDLKISDLPPVPYFPVDSLLEWTDYRSYGLRSATAYVLVFDLSNAAETFRHIKCLRDQMACSRDMRNVPVVVVGNKHDRLHERVNTAVTHPPGSFFGMPFLSSSFGVSNSSSSAPTGVGFQTVENCGPTHINSVLLQQQQQLRQQQKENALALAEIRERRDIANMVRKHWRCIYVECSAKYNWKVLSIFRELMQAVTEERGVSWRDGDSFKESENLVPRVQIANNKETMRGVCLYRHQRTPIVVDELQDVLNGSKCELL